jgi:predicted Zn-ribbon and HTH transcriptional regulator
MARKGENLIGFSGCLPRNLTSQRNYAYKSAALRSAPKTRPKRRVFAFLGLMAPARQQPSRMPKPQPVIRGRQISESRMGDVVQLTRGRALRGKAIPKPVECKDCGDDIETARIQAVPSASRCISCAGSWERRFKRDMEAVRDHQTVQIIR